VLNAVESLDPVGREGRPRSTSTRADGQGFDALLSKLVRLEGDQDCLTRRGRQRLVAFDFAVLGADIDTGIERGER
jgi:hypothetical protein